MATTALHDDDHALGQRFRAGDPGAIRDIHHRYGAAMHTIARAMLRDRELAADAVQQAFLQAWRSAEHFDPERRLGPWLYQITRRSCIDVFRRDKRHHATERVDEHDLDPADDGSLLEQRWVIGEVRRAIDHLPAPEQSVARLAHVEGLTHREIAVRLAVPVGTVKSRTSRAHARLATLLAHLAPRAPRAPRAPLADLAPMPA
jgi:RNA polymerase sigma-70 factor (ECF subfamily)